MTQSKPHTNHSADKVKIQLIMFALIIDTIKPAEEIGKENMRPGNGCNLLLYHNPFEFTVRKVNGNILIHVLELKAQPSVSSSYSQKAKYASTEVKA